MLMINKNMKEEQDNVKYDNINRASHLEGCVGLMSVIGFGLWILRF